MVNLTFYIVDVFAEEKYAGNLLAVVRGGRSLSSEEMLHITREMNYSETTFIMSETERNGGFDVRIFTPAEEVPFAGHPTLGTAHIIRTQVAAHPPDRVALNLKVGQIPVTFNEAGGQGIYWMQQVEPTFGSQLRPEVIARVLNLAPADVDGRFPVEEVSTGLPFWIVPLKSLQALQRARVETDKYLDLIKDTWAKGILIFCPEGHKSQENISVRVFVAYFGVPEDPATGSGNGCLAAYLARHRFWGKPSIDVQSEQGYEIGRPSLLHLRAGEKDGRITAFVGGKVIMVARGELV